MNLGSRSLGRSTVLPPFTLSFTTTINPYLRRLALIYQHLHQERHDTRIVDLLDVHQSLELLKLDIGWGSPEK